MGATSDAPAARRIVRGWVAYLTVMAAASLPACEMDPFANPAPELERGPVTLRSLSASIGPGVPVVLSAGAAIADSGSCPYAEDATLPITVWTTGDRRGGAGGRG